MEAPIRVIDLVWWGSLAAGFVGTLALLWSLRLIWRWARGRRRRRA
jgi:hypothetical protein